MSLKYTPSIVRKVKPRSSLLIPFFLRECPASILDSTSTPLPFQSTSANPFLPTKSPNSRSWTAPKYSARRQKVLRREADALGWSQDVLPAGAPSSAQPVAATHKLTSNAHIGASKVLDAVGLLKRGPYAGRKGQAFKGKLWERRFEQRQVELAKLLEGADAKEAAWRKVSGCGCLVGLWVCAGADLWALARAMGSCRQSWTRRQRRSRHCHFRLYMQCFHHPSGLPGGELVTGEAEEGRGQPSQGGGEPCEAEPAREATCSAGAAR